MIRQISLESFDEVQDIIKEYSSSTDEGPFAPLVPLEERLKKGLSEGAIELYASFENEQSIGFSVLGLRSGGISILYASESARDRFHSKKELFDYGFDKLSKEFSLVRIGSSSVDGELSKYALTRGFEKYDRKHMTLSRDKISSLSQRELSEEFTFADYDRERKEEMIKLIYEANTGNIDVHVFPNFFSTPEAVESLIENIEKSVYGKYEEGYSFVIHKLGKPVGVIFLTQTDDETGYIPDICIQKEERGQGLGRAILVYSFKKMIEGKPNITKINLDVTIDNPARYLYESLGFEDVRHYSVYIWNKDS